jgi:hypothetical protein
MIRTLIKRKNEEKREEEVTRGREEEEPALEPVQTGVKHIWRGALPLPNKNKGWESAGRGDDGGRGTRCHQNDP